jgi:mono/diheme cytochrome c family protein
MKKILKFLGGSVVAIVTAARGKQSIRSRLGCAACHGPDFGGHALVDDPVVGRWIAPNITTGQGAAGSLSPCRRSTS